MTIDNFIKKLLAEGMSLKVLNGDLALSGVEEKLSKQQLAILKKDNTIPAFIKANKQALIGHLSKNGDHSSKGLNKKEIERIYKLSPLQEGILFHCLYNDEATMYITQFRMDIPRGLKETTFRKAWNFVIQNHTILRTGFIYDKVRIPIQCVHKTAEVPMEIFDYSQFSKEEQDQKFNELCIENRNRKFNFQQPPLIRVTLVKTDEEAYKVALTKHHILWDGWSDQLIISEVLEAYAYFIQGQQPPSVRVDKYEDYIKFIDKIDSFKEKRFWEDYFEGFEEPSLMPFVADEDRNKGGDEFEKQTLSFNKTYSEKITQYAQTRKITKNNLIKGIWSLLLSNYTGKDDITFGLIVSGRPPESKYDKKVGLFINAIPVRCRVNKEEQISEWLFNLQQDQIKTLEYQYSSLQQIQHWTNTKGDLFDCLLNVRNYPKPGGDAIEENVLPIENVEGEENNNYLFSVEVGLDEEISIDFKYNSQLLSKEWGSMIKDHFDHVMRQIVDEQVQVLGDVQVLTPLEKNQITETFNNTTVDYPKEKTTIQLITEQTEKTPDAIAVVFEDTALTYKELDNKANQFARFLTSKGVGSGNTIGICVDRSLEMMVGLLGIMKTGNAYIPLDPTYPKDRIEYILEDAQVNFLVSTKNISEQFEGLENMEWIFLDEDYSRLSKKPIDTAFSMNDLVYLIYTSGTTGRPKGVMIEQQALVNFLCAMQSSFQLNSSSCLLAVTTYSFDISYLELFLPLLTGARLVIASNETLNDGYLIQDLLQKHRPSHMQATPSTWQLLVNSDWKNEEGTTILTGGEAIKDSLKNILTNLNAEASVWNMYGPTETTIWSSMQELKTEEKINIGKPIANTQMYILDSRDQLCPIGVAGELCIGGDGLARGYRNRSDLTTEKFFPNSITAEGRLYRTGDLAKWLPSGEIEYISRKDDQVKIRGFRIELEEIQTVMEECSEINQSVVLASEDKTGTKRLVAYILTDKSVDKAKVKTHMHSKLPDYMVPDIIIEMEAFPQTLNGKLDKKAFPKPGSEYLVGENFVAPKNETQKQIVEIWKNILELDKLGIQDNFFEMGGHSLMAMRAVAAINRDLSSNLRIKHLFENPTIEQLTKVMTETSDENTAPRIEVVNPRPEKLPLTFSQQRLWFIHTLTGSEHYHLPMVEYLDKRLDVSALKFALHTIVSRHEALRTVIKEEQGVPHQEILSSDAWDLEIEKIAADKLQASIEQEITRPFDLSNEYMLRAKLFDQGEKGYAMVITLHHIAADAWSGNIFIQEMIDLYLSRTAGQINTLKPLNVQYADYALWQQHYFNEAQLETQISYWEAKLKGVNSLNLPLDYPRPRVQSTKGNRLDFNMNADVAKQIKALCQKEGVTLFMFMLAAFKVLLSKYTGQHDICVGTPVANRTQPEIENLIGFFVNTITLRSNLEDNPVFTQFLNQVKSTTIDAYQYQDTPFEKVVDRIIEERDTSISPLFQVAFSLQNVPFELQLNAEGQAALPRMERNESDKTNDYEVAKYDLTVNVTEEEERISFKMIYCSDLFKKSTIERMGKHFELLIQSILQTPDAAIDQIAMMTKSETKDIISDFNKTTITYPKQKTLVNLFEEQAVRTPDNTAVSFDGQSLTYKVLNEQSNQLAHFLRRSGVVEENRIGLCLDRSTELIIGVLGILKAGAAYVPIDMEYPQDRIDYVLEDAQINWVVTKESIKSCFPNHKSVLLDTHDLDIGEESMDSVEQQLQTQNLAYVIYTSGSTGTPKGCMIEHRNVVNEITGQIQEFNIQKEDRILLASNITFDASVEQIFLALLSGAALYVIDKDTLLEANKLSDYILNNKITHVHMVPSLLNTLPDQPYPDLQRVISGGDVCPLSLAQRWKGLCDFYNEYGPTETTITSIQVKYEGQDINGNLPIGQPIANTQIYILDASQNIVPVGVFGEICIGGDGLARGYLNRPDLTAERFINLSFKPDKRVYRTGDIGRWTTEGQIEFRGRDDKQVKVRGYRIELGEIETVLNACDLVHQGVVVTQNTIGGGKRLVAYITANGTYDKTAIQTYLKQQLPEYMVPDVWVTLDEMPLNANGKIDHKKLPDPDFSDLIKTDFVAPRNETEAQLADIWKNILEIPQVGIYDQFFDLGGHSLLMARMIAAIRNQMQIELPLKVIFQYPKLIDLADYLIVLKSLQNEPSENEYEVLDL